MPEQLAQMVAAQNKWRTDGDDAAFIEAVNRLQLESWKPVTTADEANETVNTMLDGYYDD